jgi:hypothetical protein
MMANPWWRNTLSLEEKAKNNKVYRHEGYIRIWMCLNNKKGGIS